MVKPFYTMKSHLFLDLAVNAPMRLDYVEI